MAFVPSFFVSVLLRLKSLAWLYRKPLVVVLAIVLIAYGVWVTFMPQRQAARAFPPPLVEVVTAQTGLVTDIIEAVGTARAYESITLVARTSGTISDILFTEGDKVAAGQELIRLDARERAAEREQILAQVLEARAKRDEIDARLTRARGLSKAGAVTEARLDELNTQLSASASAVKALEARLRAVDVRLEDVVIRAPFAGRVGLRNLSVGALIDPTQRLTTLDDVSRMRLDFSVPENAVAKLKEGAVVRALSDAFVGRTFAGQVEAIDSRIDPATRTVRMTAVLDNSDEALKPGMFMQISLTLEERANAVMIPEESLVGEGLRQYVFVIVNGKAERRDVRPGSRNKGLVEIVEGIQLGDVVVQRGVQRLRPGVAVQIKGAAPAGGKPPSS